MEQIYTHSDHYLWDICGLHNLLWLRQATDIPDVVIRMSINLLYVEGTSEKLVPST